MSRLIDKVRNMQRRNVSGVSAPVVSHPDCAHCRYSRATFNYDLGKGNSHLRCEAGESGADTCGTFEREPGADDDR